MDSVNSIICIFSYVNVENNNFLFHILGICQFFLERVRILTLLHEPDVNKSV